MEVSMNLKKGVLLKGSWLILPPSYCWGSVQEDTVLKDNCPLIWSSWFVSMSWS